MIPILKSVWLGLRRGGLASIALTSVMVVWEVVENPGGIFRNTAGIQCEFVSATANSWLLPTLAGFIPITAVGHLIITMVRDRVRAE